MEGKREIFALKFFRQFFLRKYEKLKIVLTTYSVEYKKKLKHKKKIFFSTIL